MKYIENEYGAIYPDAIDLAQLKNAHKNLIPEKQSVIADGNMAAAYGVLQMWRCMIYAGFPITPSTKWLEFISAKVASRSVGHKKVKLLEAEHAVADYLVGAAASCRDLLFTTATSSVGLDHMTETTRTLGASGLGNVMLVNVYRATANFPICIEGDPSDTLAHRDDGWIQVVCRGKQQIYDTVLQLPCVGMHPSVMTPTMPGYYGLKDSHKNGRLWLESDQSVNDFQDRWIKKCEVPGLINGDTSFGSIVTSKHFQAFKFNQKNRLENAFDVYSRVGEDFQKTFGRPGLECIEKIGWPDDNQVDLAVISMGPDVGTLEEILAEECQRTGKKIGLLAVRLLSPFPYFEYARLLENVPAVAVVNQASHQGRGHLTLDISDAVINNDNKPVVSSFFAGLGGANVSISTWQKIIDEGLKSLAIGKVEKPYQFVHEGVVL